MHWGLYFFVFVLMVIIILYFIFPPLLSSERARQKASLFLTKAFKRPVVMQSLTFSWKEGFSISRLCITNQDRTPLLVLNFVQLLPDWRALLAKKFKATSLTIKGIKFTIIRDKTGRIQGDNLVATFPSQEGAALADKGFSPLTLNHSLAPRPKKKSGIYRGFSAFFSDTHITEGVFTFIDQRLNTTTQIKIFSADLNIRSLKKPIKFLLQGTVVLNNSPPEPLRISGSALLFFKEKMNRSKVRGTLAMQAGFGQGEGFFDLDKFNSASPGATGGRLICSLDLDKLSQVLAGILGFPPGYSWKGNLRSSLEARGSFNSRIAITGATQLTNLSITGGSFQSAPFEQSRIDSSQEILLNFSTHEIKVKVFDLKSDFLKLSLAGTINNFQKKPHSNLTLSGTGDLRDIVYLLRNFFYLPPDLNLSGITQLSLSGTGAAKNFHLKGATAIRNLSIEHPVLKGRPFLEETLRISPDLLCNFKKHHVTITSLLIRGKSLAGEIKGTVDRQTDIDVEGTLSLRFNELKKQLPDLFPRGFPGEGESFSVFTIKGNLKNSIVVKGDHDLPLFSKLKVTHDLIYSPGQDTFSFPDIKAESPCLTFEGQGTIAQISKNPFAKWESKLTLHLEELQKGFQDSFPEKLVTKGKGRLVFSGEGNLKSTRNKPAFSSWSGNGTVFLDSIGYRGLGTIQHLKSTECTLDKGVLAVTLEGRLNNGPATVRGFVDFNQKVPEMKLKGEGKDIAISREQKILGYIVPISSNSSQFTGKGDFSLDATWHGTNWETEISRSITGRGVVSIHEGTLQSPDSLSAILKFLEKPTTLQFDQILSPFLLGQGKIYDNNIQVTGKDIQLELNGWTSLVYDPEKKGNPIKYRVAGDSFEQSLGRDAQKILPFLNGEDAAIRVVITGTVQKPKVSIKAPKAKDFFKGFFSHSYRLF